MSRQLSFNCSWLCIGLLILGSMGCSKGAKVRKNQFGAPDLSAPATGGGSTFVVPENLIPPGASAAKTETGVSDRIYWTDQRASDVKTFFSTALKDATVEAVREGEHVTVTGGGWVIEIYGADGAPTTIVYAKAKEL